MDILGNVENSLLGLFYCLVALFVTVIQNHQEQWKDSEKKQQQNFEPNSIEKLFYLLAPEHSYIPPMIERGNNPNSSKEIGSMTPRFALNLWQVSKFVLTNLPDNFGPE